MSRLSIAVALLAVSTWSAAALGVNLLNDPGFETSSLTPYSNVLTNFPGFQGVWGDENSTIVGVDGGSTPFQAVKQLRMDVTGGITTQTFQVLDVSAYAAAIDANAATVSASAMLNSNAQAAVGGIYVQYFTASNYGSLIGPTSGAVINLDGLTSTWEPVNLGAAVPAGTRWMLYQVAFSEASLASATGAIGQGYADATFMEIRTQAIPTPAAWTAGIALMGMLGVTKLRRTRRA